MSITTNNEKRHEIKFVINEIQKNIFIKKNRLRKIFPDRLVESVYFDTKNFHFFSLSEEGLTPRTKIRVRGYNQGLKDNLEIKISKSYHREKIVIKGFKISNFNLHHNLKKIGIYEIVEPKIRVRYLRSYYQLDGVGRITIDNNIEFLSPNQNFYNSKKIIETILEVKIQNEVIDKNHIEQMINLRESRFSKYCTGINYLFKSN